MKTSCKKLSGTWTTGFTGRHIILTVILVLFAFIFSASTLISFPVQQQDDTLRNKKLDILEKLESGKSISSEEIRSSFAHHDYPDWEDHEDFIGIHGFNGFPDIKYLPELPELPDLPPMPEMPQLPEFSYNFQFYDQSGSDRIISDDDLKLLRENIARNLEEMKMSIETFRNSQEYRELREKMRKLNEELREDMDHWRDEYRDAVREQRSGRIL